MALSVKLRGVKHSHHKYSPTRTTQVLYMHKELVKYLSTNTTYVYMYVLTRLLLEFLQSLAQ